MPSQSVLCFCLCENLTLLSAGTERYAEAFALYSRGLETAAKLEKDVQADSALAKQTAEQQVSRLRVPSRQLAAC